ncbi:MAG: DUF2177 family protein [Gemmatimonadales bacterium]
MKKEPILAALAAMATIAVVGGLLYGVVFAGFIRSNLLDPGIMKSPPAFGWIALSHVPFGILLTLVVHWRGARSARGGATTGALLGFLMATSFNLAQFGTMEHWSLRLTLLEPFITAAMVGAGGTVVGLILARVTPTA